MIRYIKKRVWITSPTYTDPCQFSINTLRETTRRLFCFSLFPKKISFFLELKGLAAYSSCVLYFVDCKCQNGGICRKNKTCTCSHGWKGEFCGQGKHILIFLCMYVITLLSIM